MSASENNQLAVHRSYTKAAMLLALSTLGLQTNNAVAAGPDQTSAAHVRGTYECNSGTTAIVTPNKQADVQQHTPSNPLLRVTVGPTSALDLLWWDKTKKDWKSDPSSILTIKKIEATEKDWSVMFEGTFGDRIVAAVSGSLSWLPNATTLGSPEKPTLILTQWSLFSFASASALVCDKL